VAAVDWDHAQTARAHLLSSLRGRPNVNGVGIAPVEGGFAIKVNLVEFCPEANVPDQIDGVDVRVEVVGRGFKQLA
jgi:hypothetical protein